MAQTNANLIWKIADLLRGPYQPNQYGYVILPFTILRRLDCILEPTKEQVLARFTPIQSSCCSVLCEHADSGSGQLRAYRVRAGYFRDEFHGTAKRRGHE